MCWVIYNVTCTVCDTEAVQPFASRRYVNAVLLKFHFRDAARTHPSAYLFISQITGTHLATGPLLRQERFFAKTRGVFLTTGGMKGEGKYYCSIRASCINASIALSRLLSARSPVPSSAAEQTTISIILESQATGY